MVPASRTKTTTGPPNSHQAGCRGVGGCPRTVDNAPPLFASELVAPNLATTDPLGELLLLFPYVERTNAWRSTAALPLQPVIESCVQSKVAISTMPPPTDDSTSSGTLPSASHTVLPAATTPVATSSSP